MKNYLELIFIYFLFFYLIKLYVYMQPLGHDRRPWSNSAEVSVGLKLTPRYLTLHVRTYRQGPQGTLQTFTHLIFLTLFSLHQQELWALTNAEDVSVRDSFLIQRLPQGEDLSLRPLRVPPFLFQIIANLSTVATCRLDSGLPPSSCQPFRAHINWAWKNFQLFINRYYL